MLETGSLYSIVPEIPSRYGWRINVAELDAFVKRSGIKRLVVIRYSSGRYTWGSHRAIRKGYHRITLTQISSSYEANKTLLHELAHAVQSERWAEESGRPFWRFYKESYKWARGRHGASYIENEYEIEAREFADYNQDRIKLVI